MKFVRDKIGIIIIVAIIVSVGTPVTNDVSATGFVIDYSTPADSGEVTGVPYVWQEINGFCMWAAVSMAIQHAGVPLDLHGLFVASGIGFSASYIRYEENMLFMPGAFFRQMMSLDAVSSLYGLNTTMYMDASTELGIGLREIGFN